MLIVQITAGVFLGNMLALACFGAVRFIHMREKAGKNIPGIAYAGVVLPMVFAALAVAGFS